MKKRGKEAEYPEGFRNSDYSVSEQPVPQPVPVDITPKDDSFKVEKKSYSVQKFLNKWLAEEAINRSVVEGKPVSVSSIVNELILRGYREKNGGKW